MDFYAIELIDGRLKVAGPDRYRVTVYHGEGSSVFHIIDTQAPEDEQPCIVRSYRDNPSDAAMHCLALNDANDRELAACASQAPFAEVIPC